MLIEFLEESAIELSEREKKYQTLKREYQRIYDKDLREEMKILKKEMDEKRYELIESIYDNMEEYKLLNKHFPELFQCFLEEGLFGRILKKKKWLFEFKPMKEEKVKKELEGIRKQKKQLKEARKTLSKWIGKVKCKQFEATFPVLKGKIKRDLDRDEVLDIIDDIERELKKEGWKIALNEPTIEKIFLRILKKLRGAKADQIGAVMDVKKSKGKGSVKEYEAAKKLEEAEKKRRKYERYCRHILICNPKFFERIKKKKPLDWGETQKVVQEVLNKVKITKVNEDQWMERMKEIVA